MDERISDESRQEGIGEIGMIGKIEEIGAELHVYALGDSGGFVDGEIPLLEGWAAQRVASFIAEVASAGHAILRTARWSGVTSLSGIGHKNRQLTGQRIRAEVDEI